METFQTKQLLVLTATSLLCIGLCACGNTSTHSNSTPQTADTTITPSTTTTEAQEDTPSPSSTGNKIHHDSAYRSVLDWGHEADHTERSLITALVRRYYKAEADEDGAAACSMLYSPYAESIQEDYGTSPPGPVYARGNSCAAVMTLVFKHFHNGIVARLPKLEISRVRLKAHQGVAVLSFGAMPEREIHVTREGHTWRIVALTDNEIP